MTVTPLPGFLPGVVTVLSDVVAATRAITPYLAVMCTLVLTFHAVAGARSSRARELNRLAKVEYTGVEHLEPATSALRRFLSGTGLAVLSITLIGATSGVEEEVVQGSLRPIDAMTDLVGGEPVTYILQSPNVTFMDDSVIPPESADEVAEQATFPVVPFGKHLFNIDDGSAIQVSIPDDLYADVSGRPVAGCSSASVIVDDTVRASPGDHVLVNGVLLRVARVDDGIAQMNRSVGVLSHSTVRDCLTAGQQEAYFGVIALTDDIDAVRRVVESAGPDGLAVVSAEDFAVNKPGFLAGQRDAAALTGHRLPLAVRRVGVSR
ncbi:MAG: hypothetical protein QM621_03245 [Aeromicrobium sp.]|uniref:hypothetical protein n=1 Tax=Aeromicrobium sp. TaxID=1871063 RepID=UPI0039E2DDC2